MIITGMITMIPETICIPVNIITIITAIVMIGISIVMIDIVTWLFLRICYYLSIRSIKTIHHYQYCYYSLYYYHDYCGY